MIHINIQQIILIRVWYYVCCWIFTNKYYLYKSGIELKFYYNSRNNKFYIYIVVEIKHTHIYILLHNCSLYRYIRILFINGWGKHKIIYYFINFNSHYKIGVLYLLMNNIFLFKPWFKSSSCYLNAKIIHALTWYL